MEDTLHNPSFFIKKEEFLTEVVRLSTCAAPPVDFYKSFSLLDKLGGKVTFAAKNKIWIRTTVATNTSFDELVRMWNIPNGKIEFIDSDLFSCGIISYYDAENNVLMFLYKLNPDTPITYEELILELCRIQSNFKESYRK